MIDEQGTCDIRKGDYPDPLRRICNKAAMLRYPAMGGGYMLLCEEHGEKHRRYCERWDGEKWLPAPALPAIDRTKANDSR